MSWFLLLVSFLLIAYLSAAIIVPEKF
ncbi:hypothetical protein BZG78_14325 [Salinivibrio sp. MA351]|nr:hypothetical protein BZG78_14325 [Salinivibrio sp. MA351]